MWTKKRIEWSGEIKDRIDLRRLFSYLSIPFWYSETERGPYILARVPWREDRHPSFIAHLRNGRWLWYDLARREGGSVIDFVICFFSADYKSAITWLKQNEKAIAQTSIQGTRLSKEGTAQRIELIDDPEMMEKIRQIWKLRKIPSWLKLGRRIFIQLKTRIGKSGEIESFQIEKEAVLPVMVFTDMRGVPKYWREIFPEKTAKGYLLKNEPILLKHGGENLYIVEGYTDALAIFQVEPEADILVLGGVANTRNLPLIKGYRYIYIATDNDEAGERAYRELRGKMPTAFRFQYKGKDPMESWLTAYG